MSAIRIGVLTPSSNTVLEPVTSAILSEMPGVSAHFARFPVTHISPTAQSQSQFDPENLLIAARLLADAKVNVIIWSGTAASWLGFEQDRQLCQAITRETGVAAGSAVLGVNALFEQFGVRTFGLVSPYVESIQDQIQQNYLAAGYECTVERHLNEQDNYSFALFDDDCVNEQLLFCAGKKPDAITVMCTNMRGARLAAQIEQQTGVLVIDSTSAAVWHALSIGGSRNQPDAKWGRIFTETTFATNS